MFITEQSRIASPAHPAVDRFTWVVAAESSAAIWTYQAMSLPHLLLPAVRELVAGHAPQLSTTGYDLLGYTLEQHGCENAEG